MYVCMYVPTCLYESLEYPVNCILMYMIPLHIAELYTEYSYTYSECCESD